MEYGIVYVLTNPCMPGLVKIGMTEKEEIDQRMKDLYTTAVPLPFECKFACKVKKADCLKLEKALHRAFEPQRINANREFFKIQPEQAIAILELFHHVDITAEVAEEIENDLTPEDKTAQEKAKTKRPALHFLTMGLKEGDVLVYKNDPSIKVTVLDEKHVIYKGEPTTLTPITSELLGKTYSVQPTPFWMVEETGRNLTEIYDETYPMEVD